MTNNAKVGGVLSIVAGAFGVLWLLFFIAIGVVMLLIPGGFDGGRFFNGTTPAGFFAVMAAIYIIIGIFYALVGVLAIVGGVFALRKRHWGWALAGAIGGTIVFLLCGVPAIIFIAMGKAEFQKGEPAAPAPAAPVIG